MLAQVELPEPVTGNSMTFFQIRTPLQRDDLYQTSHAWFSDFVYLLTDIKSNETRRRMVHTPMNGFGSRVRSLMEFYKPIGLLAII